MHLHSERFDHAGVFPQQHLRNMVDHLVVAFLRHQSLARPFTFFDMIIEAHTRFFLVDEFLVDVEVTASDHEDIAHRLQRRSHRVDVRVWTKVA